MKVLSSYDLSFAYFAIFLKRIDFILYYATEALSTVIIVILGLCNNV